MTYSTKLITQEDINSLLRVCSFDTLSGLRSKVLILLLWSCRLRLNEILKLKRQDFDFRRSVAVISVGQRDIWLRDDDNDCCFKYMLERASLDVCENSPFICTFTGQHLSGDYVRGMFKRLQKKAQISKPVSANAIRKSSILVHCLFDFEEEELVDHLGYKNKHHLNAFIKTIFQEFQDDLSNIEEIKKRSSIVYLGGLSLYEKFFRKFG